MQPHLLRVVRVFLLLGGVGLTCGVRLIQRVEAALRAAG